MRILLVLLLLFYSFDSEAKTSTTYFSSQCAQCSDTYGNCYDTDKVKNGKRYLAYFYKKSGRREQYRFYACAAGEDWKLFDVDMDGILNGVDLEPLIFNDPKEKVCTSGQSFSFFGSSLDLYLDSTSNSWVHSVDDDNYCVTSLSIEKVENSSCFNISAVTTGIVADKSIDPVLNSCSCDAGFSFDETGRSCVVDKDDHDCAVGSTWDSVTSMCVVDKVDPDLIGSNEALAKAANAIIEGAAKNVNSLIDSDSINTNLLLDMIDNSSLNLINSNNENSEALLSLLDKNNKELVKVISDLTDFIGDDNGLILNDWNSNNFGSVISSFKNGFMSTPIVSSAVGFFKINLTRTKCPVYSATIWNDVIVTFDHWCTSEFSFFWIAISSIILISASILGFRIAIL